MIYISIMLSAALWLYFIYRYDKYEPEPVLLVLAVGFAGGLMSSLPAAVLNTIAGHLTGAAELLAANKTGIDVFPQYISFTLFVGFNEEFWKAAAAVFILKRLNEFDEPIDALIYSMTIALGFAAFENIEYTLAGGLVTLFLRSFTAVPLHIGLAAIWGAGIARAKYVNNRRYFSTLVPYVTAAALIHSLYNFIQFVNPGNLFMIPVAFIFALVLTIAASRKLRTYQKISPYRDAGICPQCGTRNRIWARQCRKCSRSFIASE